MSRQIRFTCLKASTVVAFLLIGQGIFGQAKMAPPLINFPDLEKDIETRKKELGGDLMVYIASRDTVVYQKGFGDVTARTQAPIGAASSWLATALILQLVDEGKLSLDDNVNQYLPVFGSYFKNYITIRHCMTGQTGIKTEPFRTSSLRARRYFESLEAEAADFAKRDIQANAGEEYRYNPLALNIAVSIAEKVTKKKFEQLLRQRLLTPLGMRNTTFNTDDGTAANPAAGAKSTGADMIRFLQMILNEGSYGGKQILSQKAIAEMRKVQVDKSRVKEVFKALAPFQQALGVWAIEGKEGIGLQATALAAPGLTGVWPMVDFTGGYAFVLLPKSFAGEQNMNLYMGLKGVLDEEMKRVKK
jgi:CubicO group peptidase (beta-lactamase class C family)